MSNVLAIQWTITPQIAPQPRLTCNRCGGVRQFRSSDKIRLNANGKRVDAWLIYRCVDCDNSWNRPLFERRNIRDIDPMSLRALQTNDPDFVRRIAFDVEGLRRWSERVEEFATGDVQKHVQSKNSEPLARIEITLVASMPTCVRVDRLLASELGISRARIQELQTSGRLTMSPHGARMLRRPVRDQMCVALEVSTKDDLDLERATGGLVRDGRVALIHNTARKDLAENR
jgi:hypothetical protein